MPGIRYPRFYGNEGLISPHGFPQTVRPALARPQAAGFAGTLWQGRILFGSKGLTPDAFKVLQTWATEKRASMPMLHQAMYPLNGERVGIEQMTAISQALAQDARLQNWPLTRQEEMDLLETVLLYERLLGDVSGRVRFQSVFVADHLENPEAQAYLIHRLRGNPDPYTRNYLFYLQAFRKEDAPNKADLEKTDLLDMVHDFSPWVRHQLANMLPSFPPSEKRDAVLRQLLEDEVGYVQGAAAANAHILEDKEEGKRILRRALESTRPMVRTYALAGLKHLEDSAEIEAQIRRTLAEEPGAAKHFIELKDQLNPVLWQEIVQTLAKNPDPDIRMQAIPLLTDEAERERLIMDFTRDDKSYHGNSAVYRLKEAPEAVHEKYFVQLSSDPLPSRRKTALTMIHFIKSKPLKRQVLKSLLADPDDTVRSAALIHIPDTFKPSRRLDKLIMTALRSENPAVRKNAAWAIKAMSDPQQRFLEFMRLAKDPDAEVRQAAVRVLDTVDNPTVRQAFIREMMKDPDSKIRRQTVMLQDWGNWEKNERDEAVRRFANDPDSEVREYLPYSIGKILDERLTRFLESPYPALMEETIRRLDPETPLGWQDVLPAWVLMLQAGVDGTRMRQVLIGYREVAGHAVKQREQFTQEGQKALDENLMQSWLKRTAGYMLMAVALMGPEAVKAKFDEKAAKFHQYLQMVQTIGLHPTLGPQFYQTFRAARQGYPTWQVNRTLEILYGLTMLDRSEEAASVLQEIRRTRRIDLNALQDRFLRNLGEVAGLSKEELDQEAIRERLTRWTDPYIFTIGSALNLLQDEARPILLSVLQSDLKNQFPALLDDAEKPWGEANRKTREAFAQHGLNYEQWLNYDRPMTVTLGSRTLDIELWKRNPATDLFIGSHVRTCMALDTRPEEMLDAILNTLAQYAIIRDRASGDPVGYIRMFWTLPEAGGPDAKPELIIDNVGYAFEKEDPNAPQLLGIAARYAKVYGRAVTGGREPDVYLSKYIHLMPQAHIQERPVRVVGACRNNSYYFFAIDQYMRSDLTQRLTAKVVSARTLPEDL